MTVGDLAQNGPVHFDDVAIAANPSEHAAIDWRLFGADVILVRLFGYFAQLLRHAVAGLLDHV